MDFFLSLPWELRLALQFLAGLVVGGQLNRGIYRLAYFPRLIGPWSPAAPGAPPRVWSDYLPVWGWLGMAREEKLHGAGYWVRPAFIELATGILFAWWYWATVAPGENVLGPPGNLPSPGVLQAQFVSQIVLLSFMIVATFIDFDEQTIPDEITVTGTLVGLVLAAALPVSLLRDGFADERLLACTPLPWPATWYGGWGLGYGLAAYLGWVAAILPKVWYPRRGLAKAMQFLAASVVRFPGQWRYLAMALAGSAAISAVWVVGGLWWQALLTSLLGMAFGGAIIWAVRIAGSSALAKEAMGFGDVTLMCMIGAYLGWQPALFIFFLAPLAGLVIAVGQWFVTGRHDIAFGPYLCLGAALMMANWPWFWPLHAREIFYLGLGIPCAFAVCVVLIWIMLSGWRMLRDAIWPLDE